MKYRIEKDTLGDVKVPADRYWGAQTQRSVDNFVIGKPGSMPLEVIYAYGYIKKAAAIANNRFGLIPTDRAGLIGRVCDEIIDGRLDDHFPLVVWQTGSGTQTNMNVNEVIVNRAAEISQKTEGQAVWLHPNDEVNMSQSSNDTFPAAMHIAASIMLLTRTIPSVRVLALSIERRAEEFSGIIKTGRTHLMDATPVTLGQEFSGYAAQLKKGIESLEYSLKNLSELALGATAVGTGLNSPEGFDREVASVISSLTGFPFVPAENKFEAIASHDAMVEGHFALKRLAVSLMKIAGDIRLLASGPRAGIGELTLPSNEPGSSIMPGKSNPTQAEALTMVCARVMGNDTTITVAGAGGQLELNAFKPVIIDSFLESALLLADACSSFSENCIEGLVPDLERINYNLNNSLMLVTALNKHIGYENAARIALKAYRENITLREAAAALGLLTLEEYENLVVPSGMISPFKPEKH